MSKIEGFPNFRKVEPVSPASKKKFFGGETATLEEKRKKFPESKSKLSEEPIEEGTSYDEKGKIRRKSGENFYAKV